MAFDDIFDHLSGAGWYQVSLYLLLGLPSFYGGVQSIIMTFLGPDQDHWCYIEKLACFPGAQQQYIAIPLDERGQYAHCSYYDLPYDNYTYEELANWNRSLIPPNTTIKACDRGWFYDKTEFVRTIVSEYDLVCDDAWLVQLAYSMNIAAKLIMGVIGGVLADKYGRQPLMLLGACTHLFFVFGSAFAESYGMFISMRTLLFSSVTLAYACGFVLPIELFAPSRRFIPGGLYWCYWSLGFMLLPAMAYWVRDSVRLQLVAGLPMLLHISYVYLVPESPRWQLTQGHAHSCKQTLKFIAEVNGDTVPAKVYDELKEEQACAENKEGFVKLVKLSFSSPQLMRSFLLTLPAWAGCNIVYYGLSLNTGVLSGSIFLNTAMSGFVEIPANILTMYLLTKAGRKYTLAISMILSGFANFLCIPLIGTDASLNWLMVTFNMLGKACITVAFTTLCFYALELFPTSVRALMYNASALLGGLCGLIAPFMGPPLVAISPPLPLVIFGSMGVAAGCCVFFLPDTSRADLPDTIEAAEQLGTERERRRRQRSDSRSSTGGRGGGDFDETSSEVNLTDYGTVGSRTSTESSGATNHSFECDDKEAGFSLQ